MKIERPLLYTEFFKRSNNHNSRIFVKYCKNYFNFLFNLLAIIVTFALFGRDGYTERQAERYIIGHMDWMDMNK